MEIRWCLDESQKCLNPRYKKTNVSSSGVLMRHNYLTRFGGLGKILGPLLLTNQVKVQDPIFVASEDDPSHKEP